MLPKNLRHNPGRVRAIIYAVLVHVVVIGLAIIGFRWTVDSPSTDKVVQATAVSEVPARKPEEDKKRVQEEEAYQKAEADKRRQADLKKKQDEEQGQQRLVAERRKKEAEEKERQSQAELKKKQDEEQAQQRLVAERRKKEAEEKERQKRAAEEERRKEDKRRQKLTEESLQEQLAAEEKARQQEAHAVRTASVVAKYKALISQRVSRNWNRPVGVAKGLKCVVSVRLTSTGEVLSANVVRSSGNGLFDRSVENAVYKSAPLPLPEDPTLFDNFREIEFTFIPEE